MPTETESANLYRASVMVLSDRPPHSVDVIFFHNRSFGDDSGLQDIAATMIAARQARIIAVTNNEGQRYDSDIPYEANPGKTHYKRTLMEKGVPEEAIVIPEREAFHVRQENTVFIEESRARRWETAAILAQPHQLLRTMLGVIQAMNQSGYLMEVYTAFPNPTSWQEVVYGNQGIEEKPRSEHIDDELKRVIYYQSTGELATFEELFAYLTARDKGSLRLTH